MPAFIATCPKGLESLLLQECQQLGMQQVRETVAAVQGEASLAELYRLCLWSRMANRVLLQLAPLQACTGADDLYGLAKSVDWQQHMTPLDTFAIDFQGRLPGLRHDHFAALRIKDAIADQFSERFGRRPDVQAKRPSLQIHGRVRKGQLGLYLDLSGESLHRRAYRQHGGRAPLKENLAAALLLRADWPAVASRGGALIDPMCGSGTLLIEGALMAMGIAPGLLRSYWGFSGWRGHQAEIWQGLLDDAKQQRQQALQRQWPEIRGYDASPRAIEYAEANIAAAGLQSQVRVLRKELAQLSMPTHRQINTGLLISNPPYGERLGDEAALQHLYQHLGDRWQAHFMGWQAALFTGNPNLAKSTGWRSHRQYQLFNGPIATKLLLFDLQPEQRMQSRQAQQAQSEHVAPATLSEAAQMLANRLRKNRKKLQKWLQQQAVTCYRLYDADIPEYAVAIDVYGDQVHVAEYKPPASVDSDKAEQRLRDVLAAVSDVMAIPIKAIALKQRSRQKGSQQYQRRDQRGEMFSVREGQANILVNLHDYLDTGLFLDHRRVRLFIAEQARGKRFLNLFCYTAAATVHAAMGGSRWSDSVDMSNTYLQWAEKNLASNGLSTEKHRLHRADCRQWLSECDKQYDLILLDPPTFSNSKKMEGVLDVQRDHAELIQACMHLLAEDGLLIFSNNHRGFQIDPGLSEHYAVDDRTRWSLDPDFQQRAKPIHQCWFINHK